MKLILPVDGVERHDESFFACAFEKKHLTRRDWPNLLGAVVGSVANRLDSSVGVEFVATANELRIVVHALGEEKHGGKQDQ